MKLKQLFVLFAIAAGIPAVSACEAEGYQETPEGAMVFTSDATEITTASAKISGTFAGASAVPEYKGFQWGTAEDAMDGDIQSESPLSGKAGSFEVTLTGLNSFTEYFYRSYVGILENGKYNYYYGPVKSFMTLATAGPGPGPDEPGGPDEPDGPDGPDGPDEPDGPDGPDGPTNNLPQYLSCYEIPAVYLQTPGQYTRSGDELYFNVGKAKWYCYATTNPNQVVVTHTYKCKDNGIVRNYSLLYDKDKMSPLWNCCAFNGGENSGMWERNGVGRNQSWDDDPAIEWLGWTQNSGVSGYSKGHLTASNDRQANIDANHQTFYYTNQAPQFQNGFNDGVWNTLEQRIQNASPTGRDTIYVANGVLYENDEVVSGVPIPSHFYKLIMYCSFNASGEMTAAMGAAFLYTNERHSGSYNNSSFVTTIDAVEQRSGFDFFANVPDEFEVPAENGTSRYNP